MTRGELKKDIRSNLFDNKITFYQEEDLDDSIQDAYDDIACLSKCISKKVTKNFRVDSVYYTASELGITDYLGAWAIYNNSTKRWLRDDLSIRQFDHLREDWETWSGEPDYWTPATHDRFIIIPRIGGLFDSGAFYYNAFSSAFYIGAASNIKTFDLFYWATAPRLVNDLNTFLIANDMLSLLEYYATADMLEQAQEYKKAEGWWLQYYPGIESYRSRCERLAKRDLLLTI